MDRPLTATYARAIEVAAAACPHPHAELLALLISELYGVHLNDVTTDLARSVAAKNGIRPID